MKSLLIKAVLITFGALMTQTNVSGQDGRFGKTPEDSLRALRNLTLYGDRHRAGNYEGGLPLWRVLFKEFPRASINIYIWGEPLMSHMINNAKSEEEKQAYLDTAMMMFDQRIEHFGDRANVLGRKGLFYFQHNRDIEEAGPGYEALEESVKLAGDSPSAAVVHTYMNVTVAKYQAGVFDNEKVIETYSMLMENLDKAYAKKPSEQLLSVRGMVENLFAESGAADCDALISLFGEQVEKSPDDMELLTKVNDLLTKTNCIESDLYLTVTEKMHNADPSPRTALNLSAMYNKRNNDAEAVRYIKQAIELQDDPVERANYYLDLAFIANQVQRDKQLSRQYATEALKNNPSLGRRTYTLEIFMHRKPIALMILSKTGRYTGLP
jgi:tetratricopeptide (TPR) repeat protein